MRKLIIFVALTAFAGGDAMAAPPALQAQQPKLAPTAAAKTQAQPAKADPAAAAKTPARSAKAPGRSKIMVPPPPPEIPLIHGRGDSMEFSTLGVPLDFMGEADLQRMKTRLAQSLDQLTRKADERNASINEAKNRLTQFEQLYTEGVVSRKDLKNAKRELETVTETDSDIDQRVADTRSDLARIDKRLKTLAAKKTPAKNNKKESVPARETVPAAGGKASSVTPAAKSPDLTAPKDKNSSN